MAASGVLSAWIEVEEVVLGVAENMVENEHERIEVFFDDLPTECSENMASELEVALRHASGRTSTRS